MNLWKVSNRAILWLTWGRRDSYPSVVTAHPRLWLKWFLSFPWLGHRMREAKRNHGSRQKRRNVLRAQGRQPV